MSTQEKATIGVLGGGLMGSGIAALFAAHGHDVRVFEPHTDARALLPERVRSALATLSADASVLAQVRAVAELRDAAQCDVVIEAAPEDLALKRRLFAELVQHARPTALLCSNTSVLPITEIARGLPTAERIVGTHFWNPPQLIPLVEVIQAEHSAPEAVQAVMALLRAVGKRPAHVKKDIPGFIANRLQHALWREAIAMVADGVCDAETLDDCVKHSFGLRLSVLGPLENADLVGLDLTLAIHENILPHLARDAGPHPALRAHVTRGELGMKSGTGFKRWTSDEARAVRERLSAHLVATLARPREGRNP
jgi:3-hydroxybutyryl-CoA dehydrogenase